MAAGVGKNWLPAVFILCFLIYSGLRLSNTLRSLDSLRRISDTDGYLRIAKEDVFNVKFFANDRPLGYPFLLKVVRGDEKNAALLQTILSIFSWGALAFMLARQFRQPGIRSVAFLLILFISLGRYVIIWDTVSLSESFSLALMVLIIAVWLWLLAGWDWRKAAVLALISFVWACTRDTNIWLLLFIAALTALAGLRGKRHWLGLAAIFLAIFWLSHSASEYGKRWVFPFQNVLATRLLPDPRAVEFFSNCGMPVSENLMSLSGGTAAVRDRAFYNDPALDGYRDWLDARGKSCYLRWLALHPSVSLIQPVEDFPHLIAFNRIARFYTDTYQPVLPTWLEGILYPQGGALVIWLGLMIFVIATGYSRHWRSKPLWMVWAALTFSLYPHLFLVWHGDTLGLDRHALGVIIGYFLSVWFFVLLTFDWIYERRNINAEY